MSAPAFPPDDVGGVPMTGAAAMDHAFTTSDGVSISYTRRPAPRPGAPRLVLVHSLALDRHVWDGVAARLQAAAEIVTYDCRGHGRSDRRAGTFTADLFARDLEGLLDHLSWDAAAVAGCSMGGCVALAFAAAHPDRVTHLGLVDTTAWYGEGAPAKFAERAGEARAHGLRSLADFQMTRWFTDAFRASHTAEAERAFATFLANDLECYAATCALLGSVDLRAALTGLRLPVAVIVGEEDYATPPAMAEAIHAAVPGSTLTVLRPGRHLTPIECADAIAAEIHTLLGRR